MDEKGFEKTTDFIGKSVPAMTEWEKLDLNFHIVANIDQDKCIHCGLCHITCEDTSHQAIFKADGMPYNNYTINEPECVGCNLCKLVCPVDNCITMVEKRVAPEYLNWVQFQKLGLPLNNH